MRTMHGATMLLCACLALCACDDADERLRQDVRAQVATNLATRDDVPQADREAAAATIAEDVVQLRRDFEAVQDDTAAAGERAEPQRPSTAELMAEDCARQRLELDALRRLEAEPASLDDAQQQTLPAEIRRAEATLEERCPDA
jgi:membrane-bound lytic murein transglycosylase B